MSVLRNSISLSLTLSLVLGSSSAFAEGTVVSGPAQAPAPQQKGVRVKEETKVKPRPERTTEYSYDSKAFCTNAPEMMNKLNVENNEKIEKIESLKTEIDNVKNAMLVLNGINKIKISYEEALRDIANAKSQSLAEQEIDKLKTLENMKKVIRNGLTINALALLMKGGDLNKDNSFKVNTLCTRVENTQEPLCLNEMGMIQQLKSKIMDNPLDATLENFRLAYKKVGSDNQATLKAEIEKIISSIPDTISPKAILSLLDRTSPGITSILASKANKDQLLKCLSPVSSKEVLESCESLLPPKVQIMSQEGQSELSFLERMNNETTAAVAGIEGLSTVINEAAKANIKSFGSQMETYTSIGSGINPQMSQVMDHTRSAVLSQVKIVKDGIQSQNFKKPAKAGPVELAIHKAKMNGQKLSGLSTLFYNPNFQNVSSPQEVGVANDLEMKKAMERAAEWEKKCIKEINDVDIGFCKKEIEDVSTKVDGLKTELKNKLSNLETELKSINIEEDNKFSKIETLKKFVAEKYLRKCTDSSKLTTKKDDIQFDIRVDGKCFSAGHSLITLDGLASDVNQIIAQTKFAQDISIKKDATGTFSKMEMDTFKSVCSNNNSIASAHNDVCGEILGETSAREEVKDTNDWKKFNEDNWVSYDDKSSTGYTYTKKRSALSVFGSGVLPIVPQILPTFLGNYMMKQNIDNLTNQALYQKQMLHNFDVYNSNPWMYNYFGAGPAMGIAGYGNPFSTTPGTNNSTGFGF